MAILVSFPFREAILAAITGTGAPLDEANIEIALIAGPFAPDTRTTLADCEASEPDGTSFPGYARKTGLAWSTPFIDGADNIYQDLGEQLWVANADPPAPLSITGVFWTDGTDVIIEMFSAPQVVERDLDPVRYIPQFGYGQ